MPIPPIAAGDIVQAVLRTECEGQYLLNVIHYRAKVNLSETEYLVALEELSDAIVDGTVSGIVPAMVPLMGPNASVTNIQTQRVSPVRGPYLSYGTGNPGTHDDDCDAMNVAAVITKRGEVAGRGKSGSFHLGGLASSTYALGKLTGPARTLLATLADKLNDPQVTVGGGFVFEPVIFSPEGSVGANFNYIVTTTPQQTLRVMRRRTVGVGI